MEGSECFMHSCTVCIMLFASGSQNARSRDAKGQEAMLSEPLTCELMNFTISFTTNVRLGDLHNEPCQNLQWGMFYSA